MRQEAIEYMKNLGYNLDKEFYIYKNGIHEILIESAETGKKTKLTQNIAQHIMIIEDVPELLLLPHAVSKRFLHQHGIEFDESYIGEYSFSDWHEVYHIISKRAGINTERIRKSLYKSLGIKRLPKRYYGLYDTTSAYSDDFKNTRKPAKISGETDDATLATHIAVGFNDKSTLRGLVGTIFFASPHKYHVRELRAFKSQGKKLVFGANENRSNALKLGTSYALADNVLYQKYRNSDDAIIKYMIVGSALFPTLHCADKNLLKNFDTGSPFLNAIIRSDKKKFYHNRVLSPEQKEYFYQEVMRSDPEIIEAYNEFAVRLLDAVSK